MIAEAPWIDPVFRRGNHFSKDRRLSDCVQCWALGPGPVGLLGPGSGLGLGWSGLGPGGHADRALVELTGCAGSRWGATAKRLALPPHRRRFCFASICSKGPSLDSFFILD
eukprot:scaffold572_cov163-Ochromonas_danica.AAC.5